ncbi:hypothetical protein GCM10010378_70290 [Streptomyces viridochromogenes]
MCAASAGDLHDRAGAAPAHCVRRAILLGRLGRLAALLKRTGEKPRRVGEHPPEVIAALPGSPPAPGPDSRTFGGLRVLATAGGTRNRLEAGVDPASDPGLPPVASRRWPPARCGRSRRTSGTRPFAIRRPVV